MKTKLNDLFDKLEPEEGNTIDNKIQVEMDKEAEEIIKGLYKIEEDILLHESFSEINIHIQDKIPKNYTAKTINKFSLLLTNDILGETVGAEVGSYLNYLIQNSEDQDHTICLNHLDKKINFIGFQNTKNIKIIGDIGSNIGDSSQSGIIEIHGSTKSYTGDSLLGGKLIIHGNTQESLGWAMKDGIIDVRGSCDSYAGNLMKGGTIKIQKDSKKYVGKNMSGGTIIVNGEIESISKAICGGNVYHKDKQIVKDGIILDESYLEK